MGNFMGGSAWGMAQQVGEGYLLVTVRTFQRMQPNELDQLGFEMEKLLRSIRGDQPDLSDQKAVQDRQRKMQRLTGALTMLRSHKSKRR